ncbi:NnrU family protein [Ruegeria sp. HKCCA6707]|uniref:NnrU family protein n=1 Tax=unclassified Ruegeria TaxID=2625375 RepID=UPI001488DB19
MTGAGFIGIIALSLSTHSIPVRPAIKSRIVAQVGPLGFAVGHSILSFAMLALLIWSAER